ncbi:DUF7158 domain-containing protein [Kitasatospora kifunensis]|uniref:[acyl-carrier-protein] S-malonyltransferase n=1 Tax=Kitasatospora kifunensis TaxID=58351 RepID=A0A7W7QXE4_KITKI|nr:hypothetical protein [Kitasatospora kifunensis]MBB4921580.1 [acyl-carrier-protein] S-malonyltransferase [Kitasatospora kifunensis]
MSTPVVAEAGGRVAEPVGGMGEPVGLLGLLDGRPLPRAELDRRLAALRDGPRASALPAPGSAEDRQLTRWVAQVVLTEQLCQAEAAERGLDCAAAERGLDGAAATRGLDGAAVAPVRLDQRAAVELGSIAAAAYEGSAAVRAVFAAVTATVEATPSEIAAYRAATGATAVGSASRWQLTTPDGDFEADPATLPADLAAALRSAPVGETVTVGAWTVALTGQVPSRAAAGGGDADASAGTDAGVDAEEAVAEQLRACARRIAFVRWLDRARAERLTLVPGLEHPGDPAQPDNHHRH